MNMLSGQSALTPRLRKHEESTYLTIKFMSLFWPPMRHLNVTGRNVSSMTLWHSDWKEVYQEGERKYLRVYIDDHSRFITVYGVFNIMPTENSIAALKMGIEEYGNLVDHCIRHIRSRVSHPQTSGKAERFFREVPGSGSVIHWQNYIKLHKNLVKTELISGYYK